MLSTRRHIASTLPGDARAQRPIAARKATIESSPSERKSYVSRSLKAKRASFTQSPISVAPASPTSKLKSGRKASNRSSTSYGMPSDPVPKKARARRRSADIQRIDARPEPSPIAATTDQATLHQSPIDTVSDLVAAIRELYRRRQDFLMEEGSLSRRIKKIVARCKSQETATDAEVEEHAAVYPPLLPFLDSLKLLRAARRQEERKLKQHAEHLPAWTSFGEAILGFGSLSFGQIIGEAGDLSIYSNPAKLWKRMGLALLNGERQRKCLNKDMALEHGYSPRRRAMMFVIGDNLVKQKSAYRTVYDERKLFEIQKAAAEGLKVVPAAKMPKGNHAAYRSAGHIHLRAKRYMEKRLLRDLWRAWRDQGPAVTLDSGVNSGSPTQ